MQNGARYMRIYDDVAVSDRSRSPTSTVTTEMCASSPTSSIGTQCPIYENIADFAPLTYSGPPGAEGSGARGNSSLEKSEPLSMDFINNIPPPPLTAGGSELDKCGSDYDTGRRQLRPLDMRPLSLPASERKRLERKSNHALLAVFVSTVICMTMFALAIWYYYSDIVKHLKSAINSL